MSPYEYTALQLLQEGKIRVTHDGRVWRYWDGRNNVKRWLKGPREIKPRLRKGAQYPHISLAHKGRSVAVHVHRLVWMAFNGPIPDMLEINHKNGKKLDSHLDNLELLTTQGNSQHAHATGLTHPVRGEKHPCAQLPASQVLEIRALSVQGWSVRRLARRFSVSYHSIWCIVTRRTWVHL